MEPFYSNACLLLRFKKKPKSIKERKALMYTIQKQTEVMSVMTKLDANSLRSNVSRPRHAGSCVKAHKADNLVSKHTIFLFLK